MLYGNNSFINARFVAGALGGVNNTYLNKNRFISNALAFGSKTSVPQGYTSIPRGITPTLQTSGNIAARLGSEYALQGALTGIGNMAATADVEFSMTAFGNVLGNIYAGISFAVDMTGDLKAQGNIAANIDWAARPSAFDIAQEVWNAQATAFNTAGTMGKKLNDAGSGGASGNTGGIVS